MAKQQRFSDTTFDAQSNMHKLQFEEKQRSESLPGTSEQIHVQRPYTGAISKLKTIEPRDALSSQDSGINMSFSEDERMRKFTRNSIEK